MKRLVLVTIFAATCVAATCVVEAFRPAGPAADVAPYRIVSLIPAVTEMIFAMGEQSRIVGVSTYDRFPPAVEKIDRVGGLLDPNVEKILSLRPDLVIVYATQQELKQRLERAKIPFYSYEHRGS